MGRRSERPTSGVTSLGHERSRNCLWVAARGGAVDCSRASIGCNAPDLSAAIDGHHEPPAPRVRTVPALGAIAIAAIVIGSVLIAHPWAVNSSSPPAASPSSASTVLAFATDIRSHCQAGSSEREVIQDRRGQIAVFLFASATTNNLCLVSLDGSNRVLAAASGIGTLAAPAENLVVGGGMRIPSSTREPGMTLSTGRVSNKVVAVRLLSGGRAIDAAVSGGYYLAWWQGLGPLDSVIAFDANGSVVGRVNDPAGY